MSSISCGIVGLPNIGKSTLFSALTSTEALIANYPFATIEPNIGIVPVPDQRLKKLADLYNAKNIVPATIQITDIAGLVKGANKGEGLGNQFLANIRSCDAILHVIRAFEDNNVIHVHHNLNPKEDIEIIQTELMLADIATIEKHLLKLTKEVKANPKLKNKLVYLNSLKEALNKGQYHNQVDTELLNGLQLLTLKPVIYVFNLDEQNLSNQEYKDYLASLVPKRESIFICAKLEYELLSLAEQERLEFLKSYDLTKTGLEKVIHKSYDLLGLQSYLTAGAKEVRAWTIKKGTVASKAAGVIHGDFEKGFIAAEIINYQELIDAGSFLKAKQLGKVRTEGKNYIMQPDDIVEFRFNVSK